VTNAGKKFNKILDKTGQEMLLHTLKSVVSATPAPHGVL